MIRDSHGPSPLGGGIPKHALIRLSWHILQNPLPNGAPLHVGRAVTLSDLHMWQSSWHKESATEGTELSTSTHKDTSSHCGCSQEWPEEGTRIGRTSRDQCCGHSVQSKTPPPVNLLPKEHRAFKSLQDDGHILISPADKGPAMVVYYTRLSIMRRWRTSCKTQRPTGGCPRTQPWALNEEWMPCYCSWRRLAPSQVSCMTDSGPLQVVFPPLWSP